MADPSVSLYMPPPGPGNYGWRPALHNGARFGDGRMSMPIVIALVLSIIIFILFLWFFLSPLVLNRSRLHPPPRPIDVEDAYFIDENIRTPPPHIPGLLCGSLNTHRVINTHKSTSPPLSIASPPPAYTPRPASPSKTDSTFPFLSRLSTSRSTGSAQRHRSFRNIFGAQHALPRSPSAPLPWPISKPIPHPEHPLPGPDVLPDPPEGSRSRKASRPDTTLLRPCAAPHAVSDSTLHPPAIYLPSQAVVHNVRDTLCRSFSEGESLARFPVGRFSARSGRRTTSGQDISITSSKIGLAF
ncbi:hypothetical protein BJ912DRAFT_127003 [Pholiota molesta]|nr:hypothetical protein BJ912DRAFT_127003 [Pholiota molesta]